LLCQLPPVEIADCRPQRAAGVVGSERVHRNEQTSLVVLEAGLAIGDDRIAKLVAAGKELAKMRATRQFWGVIRHAHFRIPHRALAGISAL
jgi:hypothetical protein